MTIAGRHCGLKRGESRTPSQERTYSDYRARFKIVVELPEILALAERVVVVSLKFPAVAKKFPVVRLAEQLHPPTRVDLPQGLAPRLWELGVLRREGNASRQERGSPEIFLELVGGEPRRFLDGACSVGVFSQSRQDLGEVPVGIVRTDNASLSSE